MRVLTYEKAGNAAVGVRLPGGIAPSGYDDMVEGVSRLVDLFGRA